MKEILKGLIGEKIYCLYSDKIELNTSSEETKNIMVVHMTPYVLIRLTKKFTFGVKILAKQIDDELFEIIAERNSIEELKHNELNFSKHFIRPLEKILSINVYYNKDSLENPNLAPSLIEICLKSSSLVLYPSYIPFGGVMTFLEPIESVKIDMLKDFKLIYSLK